MSDSNSPHASTLSLDSGNSEVVSPLDSLFKSCLNALSLDGDSKKTTMPGLFKVLALIDKGPSRENPITKDESISRLLSSLPVPVSSSSTIETNPDERESSCSSEILTDHLNPQKIGSSIFYDSSDKGDTLTPWRLKGCKFQSNESELPSAKPNKLLGEPAMSGDCLSMDHKFSGNLHKLVFPQQVVHEVYYSLASTDITICDSDTDTFQELIEEVQPTEDANSPNSSDNDHKNDERTPTGRNGPDSSVTDPNQVKMQENACASDSVSDSMHSENDNNNNNIGDSENPIKLTASASPIEFSVPDFFCEDEISPPDEDISNCLRQFVGTNISLTPRSPALARKYSEDFSNFFY